MDPVETFTQPTGQLSRRNLIKTLAATFTVAQLIGLGVGGPESAAAAPVATVAPPSYAGIIGLL